MAAINQSNNNLLYDADNELELVRQQFTKFLDEFEEVSPEGLKTRYYHLDAARMREAKKATLFVNFNHLMQSNNTDLIETILHEYFKYEPAFRRGAATFLAGVDPDFGRAQKVYLGFFNLYEVESIRQLKTTKLGRLTAFAGTVTKTTEVRPELLEGMFLCALCKSRVGPVEQQFKYTPPRLCTNKLCQNKTRFDLVMEGSTFADWQKVKLQEAAGDLPSGATPRSIDVILRHEVVEKAQPGDKVVVVGMLIVVPDVYSMLKPGEKHELEAGGQRFQTPNAPGAEGVGGLEAMGVRDINYKLVFLANNVTVSHLKHVPDADEDDKYEEANEYFRRLSPFEQGEIVRIKQDPDVFRKLANVIAPSVYGCLDVKKGLLLMLLGGVNKRTAEGMKLRGDVNVCMVGDPATAKSQFLKFIHNFSSRCVYASGRGSSAAGLTAALSKDPETGEFTIEAGALLLADNGICCIDEFEKMAEKDVVAIHEAMEQQTISITKAGVQAQLNARCSILAAANPVLGRYDRTKNLRANVNIAPPLMSRFDLFFVLTDDCNPTLDEVLARYIVDTHVFGGERRGPEPPGGAITVAMFKRYLAFARRLNPIVGEEAAGFLEKSYVRMRANEFEIQRSAYRVTIRQLEALIRLSEGIARAHLSLEVTCDHVAMAADLLNNSIIKVQQPDVELNEFDDFLNAPEPEPEPGHEHEAPAAAPAAPERRRYQITSDEYVSLSRWVVEALKESAEPLRQSELTLLLLNKDLSRILSVDELHFKEKIVNAVVRRMTLTEKVLLAEEGEGEHEGDPLLALHPNFNDIY